MANDTVSQLSGGALYSTAQAPAVGRKRRPQAASHPHWRSQFSPFPRALERPRQARVASVSPRGRWGQKRQRGSHSPFWGRLGEGGGEERTKQVNQVIDINQE